MIDIPFEFLAVLL